MELLKKRTDDPRIIDDVNGMTPDEKIQVGEKAKQYPQMSNLIEDKLEKQKKLYEKKYKLQYLGSMSIDEFERQPNINLDEAAHKEKHLNGQQADIEMTVRHIPATLDGWNEADRL